MGIVSTVTPGTKHTRSIPRRQVESDEISGAGYIEIVPPKEPRRAVELRYNDLSVRSVADPSQNLEVLWEMSLLFETDRRASWSGTMQSVLSGEHPGKSSVLFLPMIDMSSSDVTCIYSTLKFIADHALRHGITTPIVTFDQPLWWKAYNLVLTEPIGSSIRNVLVRLGGLHTESSFLGAIGHLMGESWEQINGEDVWVSISQIVSETKISLRERSRTSALWLQYMDMVKILRMFIKAERTGNWELHLQALYDMLPYLAASGHNLYVKCVHLYLESMGKLQTDHPEVYRSFISGRHVVRRSDRYWGGLSTDLIIEQCLMRSLKTSGGITRGRGLTEQQRVTWLLAMPACAEVNRIMQELSGVNFSSGEQNKDMSTARKVRDAEGTVTIMTALLERTPFDPDPQLRNIMNGVHADSSVNVDEALKVGKKVLASMKGKKVEEHTFKKNDQAITLASKSAVTINNERVEIDPQLLFQRLILTANVSEDLPSVFRYELSSFPASLFDSSLMLRQANKPVLADAIWDKLTAEVKAQTAPAPSDVHYVLDGGALLHRVVWPTVGSVTYGNLCQLYCNYVTRKYSKPTVVFDGYSNTSSTKQMTQQRRSSGKVGPTITFTRDMKVTQTKALFLANSKNKERLITMISESLRQLQCATYQADGDADLLIVNTAIQCAKNGATVLVGDDTDLLVLLLFHSATANTHDLYFIPEPKSNSLKRRVWNVKKVQAELGAEICANMLFIHAILGCDTTSRVHGVGKGASLKTFCVSPAFQQQAEVFQRAASNEEVISAGENALVLLCNGKPDQSLDALRYQRYQEKLATNTAKIDPNSLPPTSASARFHSLRVYAQVLQWKGQEIDVEEWGWARADGAIVPIMTDLPPAPESLLWIVRCNCANGCSTKRCSCRKNNIECSPACGKCKGSSCSNCPASLEGLNDEEDEED